MVGWGLPDKLSISHVLPPDSPRPFDDTSQLTLDNSTAFGDDNAKVRQERTSLPPGGKDVGDSWCEIVTLPSPSDLRTYHRNRNGHWFGPSSPRSKGKGHPLMFGFNEVDFMGDFPEGGGYPKRFLALAFEALGVTDPDKVLHLCSGSIKRGVTVDIRPECNPTVCCDARNTPFEDESFDWIMADPPYSMDYATNLYGTGKDYPKPGELLAEASRLLRPSGRVGLLHFQVPMFRHPLRLVKVYGITTGLGYAIRAFTILEKEA